MADYTPGPWQADLHSGPAPMVRREDGHPICLLESVRTGGADRPAANARLIAASPDLLNALTVLADAAESRGIPTDAARAAIAKATLPREGSEP